MPMGERNVWATRARIGAIFADAAAPVPISERYFLGGSTTLRGWGRYQVAPLTPDGLPVGGRAMLDMSTEWRMVLRGSFGAALFVDAGQRLVGHRRSRRRQDSCGRRSRPALDVAARHRPRGPRHPVDADRGTEGQRRAGDPQMAASTSASVIRSRAGHAAATARAVDGVGDCARSARSRCSALA